MKKTKKLVRPRQGRVIGGVAKGIADHFNVNVTFVRILWILLLIPGGLPGLVPYVLCWFFIPSDKPGK